MASSEWWLYILRCGDGTLYTGIAVDVQARLDQHRAGLGAKYTRGRGPLQLVYQVPAGNRSQASKLEYNIKRMSRARKEHLIKTNKPCKE